MNTFICATPIVGDKNITIWEKSCKITTDLSKRLSSDAQGECVYSITYTKEKKTHNT